MKTETIHAVEMVRTIRDKPAALCWKDRAAYLIQMKNAAKKMKELLSKQRAHSRQQTAQTRSHLW